MPVPINRYRWDNKSKRITFRLTVEDFNFFEAYCKERGESKQAVLSAMIQKLKK